MTRLSEIRAKCFPVDPEEPRTPPTPEETRWLIDTLIESLDKLTIMREALEKVIKARVSNLRETCPGCDDRCDHGAPRDIIVGIAKSALEATK